MEQKADYTTDTKEAVEMLGKGYDTLIIDEAPRDYYFQTPNLVDDYGLSPFAYRLYGHFRRVAGDTGKCWQSTKTLAKACSMSAGTVSNAKVELTNTDGIPFIRVRKVKLRSGQVYDEVTLTDLWKINHDVYTSDPVHHMNEPRSPHERLVHHMKQRIFNIKNTPLRETEEPNEAETEFKQIASALSTLTGGGLNSTSADFITTWMEKHETEWILKAIEEAKKKGARSAQYVDKILIGWEANGYPKSREQKVKDAKKQNPLAAKERTPEELERDLAEARKLLEDDR